MRKTISHKTSFEFVCLSFSQTCQNQLLDIKVALSLFSSTSRKRDVNTWQAQPTHFGFRGLGHSCCCAVVVDSPPLCGMLTAGSGFIITALY